MVCCVLGEAKDNINKEFWSFPVNTVTQLTINMLCLFIISINNASFFVVITFTFSPSGKLVQIEYALAAVAAGGPSVGIKGEMLQK